MLLGLSSTDDAPLDPTELRAGAGVAHGLQLAALVDALARGDRNSIDHAFDELDSTIGRAARIDAVAVYANFSMMTRVADGTGTPLDRGTTAASTALRAGLGVDEFTSARV